MVTFKNGRKEYSPYIKIWWGWEGLRWGGETGWASRCDTRAEALRLIDKNHEGNATTQTIEFEYITK